MVKQRNHSGEDAVNSNKGGKGWSNQSKQSQTPAKPETNPNFSSDKQTTGGKSFAPNKFVNNIRGGGSANHAGGHRTETHDSKKARVVKHLNA